jgi:hypothetical protein
MNATRMASMVLICTFMVWLPERRAVKFLKGVPSRKCMPEGAATAATGLLCERKWTGATP